MSLDGKVVLITGAGKGSGRELAQLFARQGARVAVNDVSPVNLDDLVQGSGGSIRAYPEDIAKKVGVQSVLNQVEDELGRVDILVNHAAVEPRVSLLEMDEWDLHRVMDVNLSGAYLAMQSAARVMRLNRSGLIFNMICLDPPGNAQSAAYAASMYGLIGLTRAAAAELGRHGILVHALGRGIPQFHQADPSVPTRLDEAILFLCESSLNGQVVNVEAP